MCRLYEQHYDAQPHQKPDTVTIPSSTRPATPCPNILQHRDAGYLLLLLGTHHMMPLVGPDGGAFGHVDAVTFQGLVTVPGMAGFERS